MKKRKTIDSSAWLMDKEREWLNLTPAERFLETTKLWKPYIALGGDLDPEPDPQSPFYAQEIAYQTKQARTRSRTAKRGNERTSKGHRILGAA